MTERAIRLLAVDVDGTLVNGGHMHADDANALRRAAAEGVVVCLCTGRSWAETKPVWTDLALPGPQAPVICVGGALVVEPHTGRSLYAKAFDRATAAVLAADMRKTGYPVMALVDAWRESFDYFMIGRIDEHPLYQRFFGGGRWSIRYVSELDQQAGPRPLRISVLEDPAHCMALVARWREAFAGRIEIQAIFAPNYGVHIVESFAAGVSKMTALSYVGQGYKIPAAAMAAIGDDYNDLPMLRGVSLSATTADAPEELRQAASLTFGPRGSCAVAQLVERVLAS